MNHITIVHLSDIHIKSDKDKTLEYFQYLPNAICREVVESELVLILVSGDIAYAGTKNEYDSIWPIFTKLADDLTTRLKTQVKWIMVPGNHDGTFKDATKSRAHLIAGVLKDGPNSIDDSVIDTCVAPQKHYFDFERKFCPSVEYFFKDQLLGIKSFNVSGKTVHFWELNASWMSRVPEQQGSLVFPIEKYQDYLHIPADYRFAVLHHPLNWYAQDSYQPLRKTLNNTFCGVFSGHEHVSNGHIQKSVAHDNHCVFMEAGALGPHENNVTSHFTLLVMDVEDGSIKQTDFQYDKSLLAYKKIADVPRALQVKLSPSRKFQPTDATAASLEELGAPFTHPTRDELKLSDVYVEPEFSTFSVDDKPQATVKSREIYGKISSLGYLIIRGDEHHGKTSFLSQLFSRALIANIVPVRVSAKEISIGNEEKRDRLIEERVIEHYGGSALEHYRVLDRDQKLILLDDFDSLGMNAEHYQRAVGYIKRSFSSAVLTVSERFDVSLLGSTAVANDLSEFDEFRLLGFSYAMRSDLIQRWYALDLSLDKTVLDSKVHDAQTQIDFAVSKDGLLKATSSVLMVPSQVDSQNRAALQRLSGRL